MVRNKSGIIEKAPDYKEKFSERDLIKLVYSEPERRHEQAIGSRITPPLITDPGERRRIVREAVEEMMKIGGETADALYGKDREFFLKKEQQHQTYLIDEDEQLQDQCPEGSKTLAEVLQDNMIHFRLKLVVRPERTFLYTENELTNKVVEEIKHEGYMVFKKL